MNALTLLGRPTSINVRKVLWLCHELGLAPDHQADWAGPDRPTRVPEFLALNPNALVPVLIDRGFVLWESNTICRYLAAREGRTDLLPTEAQARARVEQWMDWQATQLNTAWRHAFMSLVRQHPGFADPAAVQASVADWNRHMQMLEEQLQRGGPHVLGETFTLADIVLGLATQRWLMTPMDRPELPAVRDWFARLQLRDGFRLHGCNGLP